MLTKLKPKSEFSRNVLTLMTGTTIAQAIPIAISPILTRIYTPEDFGVFALYFAILSLVGVIATARYEIAIVLPKTDKNAVNILALAIIITLFMTLMTTLVIYIFKDMFLELFNARSLNNLLYFIPFSLFITGLYNSFNYWSNRNKYYKTISNASIMQSLGTAGGQATFGFVGIFGGMIFGNIIGSVFGLLVFVKKFFTKNKKQLTDINIATIINQAKKYKDFPLINSLHVFSDVAKSSLSVVLISSFFGSATLGFYTLSLRALQTPLSIIGSSLGQVLYQRFNTAKENNETIYDIAKMIVKKLFLIALPFFIILYFVAPDMFALVFGEKWRVAGEYTQIMMPYLFIYLLISPISQVPIILGKQKQFFYIALFGNSLFLFIVYFFSTLDIKSMLTVLSISMSLYYLYILFFIYKELKCQ